LSAGAPLISIAHQPQRGSAAHHDSGGVANSSAASTGPWWSPASHRERHVAPLTSGRPSTSGLC